MLGFWLRPIYTVIIDACKSYRKNEYWHIVWWSLRRTHLVGFCPVPASCAVGETVKRDEFPSLLRFGIDPGFVRNMAANTGSSNPPIIFQKEWTTSWHALTSFVTLKAHVLTSYPFLTVATSYLTYHKILKHIMKGLWGNKRFNSRPCWRLLPLIRELSMIIKPALQ